MIWIFSMSCDGPLHFLKLNFSYNSEQGLRICVYIYAHMYDVCLYSEVNVGSCSILRTNPRQNRRSAKFDGTLVEKFRWYFDLIQMGCAVVTRHCVIPWMRCREIWTTFESVFKQNQSFPVPIVPIFSVENRRNTIFLMRWFCRLGGKHVSDEDRGSHLGVLRAGVLTAGFKPKWTDFGGNIGNQLEKASGR